jgi:hypothetical protein
MFHPFLFRAGVSALFGEGVPERDQKLGRTDCARIDADSIRTRFQMQILLHDGDVRRVFFENEQKCRGKIGPVQTAILN